MLTWPHENTDWYSNLDEVTDCFLKIAREVLVRQKLIIVCADGRSTAGLFSVSDKKNIFFVEIPVNDTWARDHGPVFAFSGEIPLLFDFGFNGWGEKFPFDLDNRVNQELFKSGIFSKNTSYIDCNDFVFEGGSFDTNGKGTLLTTASCLLSGTRNGDMSENQIEQYLQGKLGINRMLWLHHGSLMGDDTDGHIDTLARFCDENTIAYVQCKNQNDNHFHELQAMEDELKQMKNEMGEPYRLLPLPMPSPIYNDRGERLPATYANFLIINHAVLVPLYGVAEDIAALNLLDKTFINRKIVGINCLPLIQQHGSLHCVTMQIPKGVLQ